MAAAKIIRFSRLLVLGRPNAVRKREFLRELKRAVDDWALAEEKFWKISSANTEARVRRIDRARARHEAALESVLKPLRPQR